MFLRVTLLAPPHSETMCALLASRLLTSLSTSHRRLVYLQLSLQLDKIDEYILRDQQGRQASQVKILLNLLNPHCPDGLKLTL